MLARSDHFKQAIANESLFREIVAHRRQYNPVAGVDYNLHTPATINPVPQGQFLDAWKNDYRVMREQMIYDNSAPTFEQLLAELRNITQLIHDMPYGEA
jgi:hypothetical protein